MRSLPPLLLVTADASPLVNSRLQAGLTLLRAAFDMAQAVNQNIWEFAVEIEQLHAVGLTNTDLRYLLCQGYVRHAAEQVRTEQGRRSFRNLANLALPPSSCFILAEHGILPGVAGVEPCGEARTLGVRPTELPVWDAALRQLRWEGQLVKHFRLPAANQEAILAALEEEGWPPHIDDPLPPVSGIDPKTRLHDAIKNLNRNQVNRLLSFSGNGKGQGILWTPVHKE